MSATVVDGKQKSDLETLKGRVTALERSLRDKTMAFEALQRLLDDKGRELRQARQSLGEKTRVVGQQVSVSLLLDAGAIAPAAGKILEALCESFDWDAGILWQVDEGTKDLVCLEAWTRNTFASQHAEFLAAMRRTSFRSGMGLPGRVWETGTASTLFDLAKEASSRRAELAGSAGLHSACAFPVMIDKRVAFVVELLSREWREPEPVLLQSFAAFSAQIGQFLELQRARDAYHRSEVSVARRIQTSILPRTLKVEGLDIAARMLPAEEVGGDYFDVLPDGQGCWIGIGDVTGHGLAAGIVMVMVQSAIAALSHAQLDGRPSKLVQILNAMLFENIRQRLAGDDHVTLSLLRYHADGTFDMAGAHEEPIVYRARTGRCEYLPAPGAWVGAIEDIGAVTVDTRYKLEEGDVMVLYTDGLTESKGPNREEFGSDRVCALVERHHAEPPEVIRDRIFDAVLEWNKAPVDDITVLVVHYRGLTGAKPSAR